jgi:hypothetical protein
VNPDDLRLFDRYTVLKLDAFSWHLIRRLAEVRAARLEAELRAAKKESSR